MAQYDPIIKKKKKSILHPEITTTDSKTQITNPDINTNQPFFFIFFVNIDSSLKKKKKNTNLLVFWLFVNIDFDGVLENKPTPSSSISVI